MTPRLIHLLVALVVTLVIAIPRSARADNYYADPIDLPAPESSAERNWFLPIDFESIPTRYRLAALTKAEQQAMYTLAEKSFVADRDYLSGFSRQLPTDTFIDVDLGTAGDSLDRSDLKLRRSSGVFSIDTIIEVSGAETLRLRLNNLDFPSGSILRISGKTEKKSHTVVIDELDKTQPIWTPTTLGDLVWLHIEIPANSTARVHFTITHALQRFSKIVDSQTETLNNASKAPGLEMLEGGSVGQDASCKNNGNTFRAKVPDLVARMRSATGLLATITDVGNSFYVERFCTGTLLRSLKYPQQRFILTANHCFVSGLNDRPPTRNATQADVAPTEVIWDYDLPQCNPDGPQFLPNSYLLALSRSSGAQLRGSRYQSDSVLFSVSRVDGARTAAGWQRGLKFEDDAIDNRVSHPMGHSKSYSQDWVWYAHDDDPRYSYCEPVLPKAEFRYSTSDQKTYRSVQGGSSGSSIFTPRLRIFGQLYGECRWVTRKHTFLFRVDGRLERSWDAIGSWLD